MHGQKNIKLNGLVRLAVRRKLASARVPSHLRLSLPCSLLASDKGRGECLDHYCTLCVPQCPNYTYGTILPIFTKPRLTIITLEDILSIISLTSCVQP